MPPQENQSTPPSPVAPVNETHYPQKLIWILIIAGLLVIGGASAVAYKTYLPFFSQTVPIDSQAQPPTPVDIPESTAYSNDSNLGLLHIFLNSYYNQEGHYPSALGELTKIDNFDPQFSPPKDAQGRAYLYYTTDNGSGYEICQQAQSGICPSMQLFVTFDAAETIDVYGTPRPSLKGTTNAEAICVAVAQGSETPSWKNSTNLWKGCQGHSLARDSQGRWNWGAPIYEDLVPNVKFEKGTYTMAVFDQEGVNTKPRLIGKKTFEFIY